MKNILITVYTFSLGGGAEKVLSELVNNLDKDKYKITILPFAYYGVKKEPTDENVTVLPSVVNFNTAGHLEKWVKYVLVHFFPSIIRKLYIKEKYDVEISFNYQIPSFMVKRTKNNRVINWNHGTVYDLETSWLKRKLQKRSFKQADVIVAIAESTKRSIAHIFPEYSKKIKLIYNGLDLEKTVRLSNEKTDIKVKDNSVIFLGRLEAAKNPLKLTEYVKNIIDSGRDLYLYILGQGEQEEELIELIEKNNLQDRIFLLGYVNNPCPIIAQCKAVCMLSEAEGFPTVFTEGMALGVPFISSDVGGVSELSDNGKCGKVVNTYEQFRDAIDSVVFDPNIHREMHDACLEHIKNFSVSKQKKTVEDMLDNL